ncbi:hypothetical protein BKA69DRAFT_1102585 [Paraphysoderma sedebokerense]|nr:hypothetical protein BKA69DRAFT_1102585 [Paraphysoderma sedebokerense]
MSTRVSGQQQQAQQAPAKAVTFPYPMDFLRNSKVSDILSARVGGTTKEKPLSITTDSTIQEALHCLATNNVYSVLIRSNDKETTKYTHFLTIFDLLAATAFQKFFDQSSSTETEQGTTHEALTQHAEKFFNQKVSMVLGLTSESFSLMKIKSNESVMRLMDLFKRGVHRALVVDNQNNEENAKVVTQFDVVCWLHKNKHQFGEVMETKADGVMQSSMQYKTDQDPNQPIHLPESRWSGSRMKFALHMQSDFNALSGFRMMYLHKMSSLAIVDQSGKLVENLSVSDLRGLSRDKIPLVLKPVLDYIKEIRQTIPKEKQHHGLVMITKDDMLGKAIDLCMENKLHRCWVVDEEGKPLSVITLSDIIGTVVPEQMISEE